MRWEDRYIQDCAPMDETHREFVEQVNALAEADDALTALKTLFAHTEAHFAQEDRWMEESGFPPLHCHVGEHKRVLASLQSVIRMVKKGYPGLGKTVARELESWFDNHSATMDAALAWHMRNVDYSPRRQPPNEVVA
jgi:hemerythrin-like metal-binding protein